MQFGKVIGQQLSSGQKVVLDLSEIRVASPAFFIGCFAEMPLEQIRSLGIGRLEEMTKTIMVFCIDIFTMRGNFTGDPLLVSYRQAVRDKIAAMNLPNRPPGRTDAHAERDGLVDDLIHPADYSMDQMAHLLAVAIRGHMEDEGESNREGR